MHHLPRPRELEAVRAGLRRAPVTALLGPRQCGKTTLAQSLEAEHFFDLEDPRSLVRLDEPQIALEGLTGTVVIDEVQRKPDLFPLLRVLADRRQAVRYLLLGSASPDLQTLPTPARSWTSCGRPTVRSGEWSSSTRTRQD